MFVNRKPNGMQLDRLWLREMLDGEGVTVVIRNSRNPYSPVDRV